MKIYNQTKTQELTENEVDLTKGYLQDDKFFILHHEATEEVAEKSHYKTIAEYPNGGKDVEKVIDVEYQPAREAYDEYEDIKVYVLYTEEELLNIKKNNLREWRQKYFNIIDRAAWYDSLSADQKTITQTFRQALLDITDTLVKPQVPEFITSQIMEG